MFAEVSDLEAYVDEHGIPLVTAELLLKKATGKIRGRTGQHISPPQATTIEFRHVNTPRLFLPHPPSIPVTVTAVQVDGEPFEHWHANRLHIVTRTDWPRWVGDVTVSYTHGFEQVPEDVKGVTLELAARKLESPAGNTQSIRIEGFSQTWGTSGALTDDGLVDRDLNHYRLEGWA